VDLTWATPGAAARTRGWRVDELLQSLDENPWGRPYQIVRNKLRRWVPPHTESLEASLLDTVLGTLFPLSNGEVSVWEEEPPTEGEWSEDLEVSEEELAGVVKRMRGKNTAPGPNGIPGKVWALATKFIGAGMRHLFNRCLKDGVFPPVWRRAKLVFLRKENKPADTPAGYRPICLLDEEAKLLERVIAGRLVRHLEQVGPDLHEQQFGFRRARRRDTLRPGPGGAVRAGGRGSCWSSLGHLQRVQLPALGPHREGPTTSQGPSLLEAGPSGLPFRSVARVQGPESGPCRTGCVPRGSTGVSPWPPPLEPRVQRRA